MSDLANQILSVDADQESGDEAALTKADKVLQAGGLVGVPTETVYGLAGDATNPQAVAKIFELKGRPSFNPLILHCSDLDQAQTLGVFNSNALTLATHFWPGPLTLVVPKKPGSVIAKTATAGLNSVALRITAHPVMRQLAHRLGGPIAAPSANKSGSLSPTSAEAVSEQFGDGLDLILDGGPCRVGVESTVIACLTDQVQILRPGGLSHEQIAAVVGLEEMRSSAQEDAVIRSPGATLNHYAPRTPVRINATDVKPGEAALLFGDQSLDGLHSAISVCNLSLKSDLNEAAANLFQMLRQLDKVGAKSIAVATIPNNHLGAAINDRLHRASVAKMQ